MSSNLWWRMIASILIMESSWNGKKPRGHGTCQPPVFHGFGRIANAGPKRRDFGGHSTSRNLCGNGERGKNLPLGDSLLWPTSVRLVLKKRAIAVGSNNLPG